MEILEKLPGITVERHLLLRGSYTSLLGVSESQQSGYFSSSKPHRHIYANGNHLLEGKSYTSELKRRKPRLQFEHKYLKSKLLGTQSHKWIKKQDDNLDLEILGRNPKQLLQDGINQKLQSDRTNHTLTPQQNSPVLKSILKRPASGTSARSCSLLEVMSLDSGLTKLTASLATSKVVNESLKKSLLNKKSKQAAPKLNANKSGKDTESIEIREIDCESRSQKESLNLSQNVSENKAPVSPTKTVSFKLDPEMLSREKERSLTNSRKGEARWGVVISSYQARKPKERAKISRQIDFTLAKKGEVKSYNSKTPSHDQSNKENIERSIDEEILRYETLSSLPRNYIRRLKGNLSVIQNLSEPYRKFLMNRALEQTQRFSQENQSLTTTISLKNYLASVATALKNDRNSSSNFQSGTDKHYMSLPFTMQSQNSSSLPFLTSQHK